MTAARFVYYDVLDTVRTAPDGPLHGVDAALREATALVRMDLLLGTTTPLLSEPQALDSLTVLHAAEDPGFLALVRDRAVGVRLVSAPTLLDAFARRIEQGFRFSAWPELNGPDGAEARGQVRAALHDGDWALFRDTSGLSFRLHLLRELSKAVEEAGLALPPRSDRRLTPLGERLRGLGRSLVAAGEDGPVVRWLVDAAPDSRTEVYERLARDADDPLAPDLREVADAFYNERVGEDLVSGLDGGITATVRRHGAERLLRRVAVDPHPKAPPVLVESEAFRFAKPALDLRAVESAGWAEVHEFVREARGRPAADRAAELEVARLLARLEVADSAAWAIASRATDWLPLAGDAVQQLAAFDAALPADVNPGQAAKKAAEWFMLSLYDRTVRRRTAAHAPQVALFGRRLEPRR